jgi:hypothetical protein
MLISTPYKIGDVVTIKTFAGEEVVARLDEEKADSVKLSKPMAIVANAQGIGLGPFSFTVNPETPIELNLKGVLFIVKTDDEMAKQYIQSTTGITV